MNVFVFLPRQEALFPREMSAVVNQTLENQGVNIAKYHETVNMAIEYAISRPFGVYTHRDRACCLESGRVLYKTPN